MRVKGLDFLRGIAVLLVIFRHANASNLLADVGWIGVDLFFVLSGFLISGLIFKEYFNTRNFDTSSFLIRRAFKIYPSFYFFILMTVLLNYLETGGMYNIQLVLNEVFYLQSYRDGIWGHTWSLAVEEHFYIAIALLTFLTVKTKWIIKHHWIAYALIFLLVLSFMMRLHISYTHRTSPIFLFSATHLRMDGILIGVLMSYLYYFTSFYNTFIAYRFLFLSLAVVLISPAFLYPGGSFFNNTIGFSSINIGFGILVLLSLRNFHYPNKMIAFIAKHTLTIISFIGIHSYSIYLWHLMPEKIIRWIAGGHLYNDIPFIILLILSLAIGITASYAIERPFLKIRDKLYDKNK